MSTKPTYEYVVILLDACIPAIEAAAKREARKPADSYGLKKISWQHRLEAVRDAVAESEVDV